MNVEGLVLIYCLGWCLCNYQNNVTFYNRQEKFFGLGVVRFENVLCKSVDGYDGICITKRECRDIDGGAAMGRCANNIGVCCVVHKTCGGTSSYNNTYFVNPNFPETFSGYRFCTLVIKKCNSDICQIRIDFLTLYLAQPDGDGNCINDVFRISGGASIITPICGENSGQHIYLDFFGDADITISISTSAVDALRRSWFIKIAQIACDSATRAPAGCLMYYTNLTGTVNSFNYGRTSNVLNGLEEAGTREIVNLNYGVCIAMQPGYCTIQWMKASIGSFFTSGTLDMCDLLLPVDCTNDYVIIPNPYDCVTREPKLDRFCGCVFDTICTSSKPFVLTVVTNGIEQTEQMESIGNIGFSLNYMQLRCNALDLLRQ